MDKVNTVITWIESNNPITIEDQETYNGISNYINESITSSYESDTPKLYADKVANVYYSVTFSDTNNQYGMNLKKQSSNAMVEILTGMSSKLPTNDDIKSEIEFWKLAEEHSDKEISYYTYLDKKDFGKADSCMMEMETLLDKMRSVSQKQGQSHSK